MSEINREVRHTCRISPPLILYFLLGIAGMTFTFSFLTLLGDFHEGIFTPQEMYRYSLVIWGLFLIITAGLSYWLLGGIHVDLQTGIKVFSHFRFQKFPWEDLQTLLVHIENRVEETLPENVMNSIVNTYMKSFHNTKFIGKTRDGNEHKWSLFLNDKQLYQIIGIVHEKKQYQISRNEQTIQKSKGKVRTNRVTWTITSNSQRTKQNLSPRAWDAFQSRSTQRYWYERRWGRFTSGFLVSLFFLGLGLIFLHAEQYIQRTPGKLFTQIGILILASGGMGFVFMIGHKSPKN